MHELVYAADVTSEVSKRLVLIDGTWTTEGGEARTCNMPDNVPMPPALHTHTHTHTHTHQQVSNRPVIDMERNIYNVVNPPGKLYPPSGLDRPGRTKNFSVVVDPTNYYFYRSGSKNVIIPRKRN